ncbi:MAG: arylsulfatase [Opitutaceae bacterium BACL24 MAG-120322-bin51]|jgi:arylsulfatase A|nr:MAG: arylsulfatase [Opitutaceae bacterium BACL24 MAG-120322-bin51]
MFSKQRPLLSSIVASLLLLTASATADTQPNVVIIYGDDVGYGDVGAYGSKLIPTPNIDALAAGGIRFTDGHAAAATCTPSRFSMLTGIHGFREGVSILPPNAPLSIPTEAYTLPDLFKDAGYTTAVIGKWHLGIGSKDTPTDWNGKVAPGPLEIGFDYSFLLPSTNDRVPCVYLLDHHVLNLDSADPLYVGKKDEVNGMGSTVYPDAKVTPEAMTYYKSSQGHNNSVINGIGRIGYMAGGKSALWNDETMADVFVEQARNYISQNKDKPFFLYFASQDIHVPRAPHPRFQGSTTLGYRGDAMVQFDWSVGEILKALEDNGLTDNTIVIFSSDNGPVYDDGYEDGTTVKTSTKETDRGHDGSGPYRGGKYQVYEGGTRVPFLIRWPAKIKPGVSNALINQIDFMGSFAKLLDQPLPENEAVDSRDSLAALLGEDQIGLPFMIEEAGKARALRRANWKYIAPERAKKNQKPNTAQLYNLDSDIAEATNVIDQNPEVAESMALQLKALMAAPGIRK